MQSSQLPSPSYALLQNSATFEKHILNKERGVKMLISLKRILHK